MKTIRLLLLGVCAVVALVIIVAMLVDSAAVYAFAVSDATASVPSLEEVRSIVGYALGWAMVLMIMLLCALIIIASLFGNKVAGWISSLTSAGIGG